MIDWDKSDRISKKDVADQPGEKSHQSAHSAAAQHTTAVQTVGVTLFHLIFDEFDSPCALIQTACIAVVCCAAVECDDWWRPL